MAKKGCVVKKGPAKASSQKKEDPLEVLRLKIKALRRPAFTAVTEIGDGPSKCSKYSGKAYIPEGEDWPVCPNCDRPMQLFVQLDLDSLPKELDSTFGHGRLQMFYCTSMDPNCEVDNSGWTPFSKNAVVRVVQPKGPGKDVAVPNIDKYFPVKRIVDWKAFDDYPGLDDLADLGIEFEDDLYDRIFEEDKERTWPSPGQGNKLGGWPFWCQSPEYPQCPKCGKPMRLVFQIDSDNDIPYMFGDVGTGHITQCKEHKDVVTFNWACH